MLAPYMELESCTQLRKMPSQMCLHLNEGSNHAFVQFA